MATSPVLQIVWLTPAAALVGLAAAVPLAAWLVGERRVRRVRAALSLRPPTRGTWWAPAAIAATLALVAVAAAQPVLASRGGHASIRTGQVFIVVEHRYGAHVFIAHHSGNVFQSGIQAGGGQPFRRHNVAHLHGTFSFVGFIATSTQHAQHRRAPGTPVAMNVCLKARDSQANR